MPAEEKVFLNNCFLSVRQAQIPVLDPGFLSGLGLFETMRAKAGKIVYLKEHLERLARSCRLLGIKLPYSLARLERIIWQTIKINGFADNYVRLTLWKARSRTGVLVTAQKYHPPSLKKYKKGFSVSISSLRQNEFNSLAQIKTTSRLLYEQSFQAARKKGFAEAIILNSRGFIAEASRSNLFFLKSKELFTPALACGCLDGITRRVILDLARTYKIKAYQGNFTLRDVISSDEAFLTNSLMGIMPLTKIGQQIIAGGACGKLTRWFIKKYRSLLK